MRLPIKSKMFGGYHAIWLWNITSTAAEATLLHTVWLSGA